MTPYFPIKYPTPHNRKLWYIALIIIGFLLFIASKVWGAEIDLSIIAKIESNNNPHAINKHTGASGMYQFMPIAWQDVRNSFPELRQYPFSYAQDASVARLFAEAYFVLIDRYLARYGLKNTVNNKLWAYNAGVGMVVKNRMPSETKNYILKYKKLAKKR